MMIWRLSTENPDVIFRANTLATKALDYYMKLVGLPYLYSTLHAVVKEIYNYKKPFEVDPHRVDKGEDIKKNFQNLLALVQQTTNCIFESTDVCPQYVVTTERRSVVAYLLTLFVCVTANCGMSSTTCNKRSWRGILPSRLKSQSTRPSVASCSCDSFALRFSARSSLIS